MKKTILVILSILMIGLLTSCNKIINVENPICPQDGSWLCEQSEKLGVPLETAYGWIYNATAIAVISDVTSVQEVCDFEKKIADWYDAHYPMTYNSLIAEIATNASLIKDPKKAMLIANILNKELALYSNASIISPADDMILRKGHAKFRYDMLCD